MCNAHIVNSVKERMLNRRDFFRNATVGAAATVAGGSLAPGAFAANPGRVEDMTHEWSEEFPTYFGVPGVSREVVMNFAENSVNLFNLTLSEHVGTHVDAPLHFSADGRAVNEIPVENLVCPLAVIDIRERAAKDADTRLTPGDLKAWISANGPIPDGACVALLSGWGARTGGDGFRNADDEGVMHFPGFHVEAAQMLMEESGAIGIATDTLSLDHGPSGDFATHYAWLPTNRWGLECIANLERLPAAGATLVVGAPKFRGGTGGPSRVFALV